MRHWMQNTEDFWLKAISMKTSAHVPRALMCASAAYFTLILNSSSALSATSGAPNAITQQLEQRSVGPCSPNIGVNTGSVNLGCVIIDVSSYLFYLEQRRKELTASGKTESPEYRDTKEKLLEPEQAYAQFVRAAQAYVLAVGSARGIATVPTIKDALTGSRTAQEAINTQLSDAGRNGTADAQNAAQYALAFGNLLMSTGEISGAREIFRSALETSPTNGRLIHGLADAMYESGDAQASISFLNSTLSQTPGAFSKGDLAQIYDALGQALQGVGRLDGAADALRSAREAAEQGVKDGSSTHLALAGILNDSAGPAIRLRQFEAARSLLCQSWKEFKLFSGPASREIINVELNLSALYREIGKLGFSKTVLEISQAKLTTLAPRDPLIGYFALQAAQTYFLFGDTNEFRAMLEKARSFFEPSYLQRGQYPQRIARVYQYQALNAIIDGNWTAAFNKLSYARLAFSKAYGSTSYDDLALLFWTAYLQNHLGKREALGQTVEQFKKNIRILKISDPIWEGIASVLDIIATSQTMSKSAGESRLSKELSDLLAEEARLGSYVLLIDGSIRLLLERSNPTRRATPALIEAYRTHIRARTLEKTIPESGFCE